MIGGIVGLLDTREKPLIPGRIKQMNKMLGHSQVTRHEIDVHSWLHLGQMVWEPTMRDHPRPYFHHKHLTVVSDSQIANRRSLIIDLSLDSMATDAEIIAAAYNRSGLQITEMIESRFTFAIWDEHKRSLRLFVDPLKSRSLYYVFHEGLFAFASELKCLLSLGLPKKVNNLFFIDHLDEIKG